MSGSHFWRLAEGDDLVPVTYEEWQWLKEQTEEGRRVYVRDLPDIASKRR